MTTASTELEAATPEQVRAGLALLTTASSADLDQLVTSVPLDQLRDLLFEAVPVIVGDYANASGTLGLDWYESLRELAAPRHRFTPQLVIQDHVDQLQTAVAVATPELRDASTLRLIDDQETYLAKVLAEIESEMQREIAQALRETVAENTESDPAASGWRRFTRAGGCKFCLFLARSGAVYSGATVRFAAHRNCNCVAGPSFDLDAPRADVLQHTASKRDRSPVERAALRDYLNEHYSDAPG